MKSFQIRDGKVKVDGVVYGTTPSNDINVTGKMGRIHSINIAGKGQFFPIGGLFDDGTIPMVDSTVETLEPTEKKKGKLAKTELVEKSSKPVGIDGKPIKKSKKGSK